MIHLKALEAWKDRYLTGFGIDWDRKDGTCPGLEMLQAWLQSIDLNTLTIDDLNAVTAAVARNPPDNLSGHRKALADALRFVSSLRNGQRDRIAKYRHGESRPLTQEQTREYLAKLGWKPPRQREAVKP